VSLLIAQLVGLELNYKSLQFPCIMSIVRVLPSDDQVLHGVLEAAILFLLLNQVYIVHLLLKRVVLG